MTAMASARFTSNLSNPKNTSTVNVTTGANAFTIWMNDSER